MIETIILNYLSSVLDVPCFMENRPEDPNSYIVIEKTGDARRNHLYSSVFAIQSYGDTLYDAASLNKRLIEAMDALPVVNDYVREVVLNSDYNYTDTQKKKYRYQAVFQVYFID